HQQVHMTRHDLQRHHPPPAPVGPRPDQLRAPGRSLASPHRRTVFQVPHHVIPQVAHVTCPNLHLPGHAGDFTHPLCQTTRSPCRPKTATFLRGACMSIDYTERIPNNVDLAEDRRLQRALESWQPAFLHWWGEMGPTLPTQDVYLRTAVAVGKEGWANFARVKLPEYRWGIFLAERDPDRRIAFGQHQGEPGWQQGPRAHRGAL